MIIKLSIFMASCLREKFLGFKRRWTKVQQNKTKEKGEPQRSPNICTLSRIGRSVPLCVATCFAMLSLHSFSFQLGSPALNTKQRQLIPPSVRAAQKASDWRWQTKQRNRSGSCTAAAEPEPRKEGPWPRGETNNTQVHGGPTYQPGRLCLSVFSDNKNKLC